MNRQPVFDLNSEEMYDLRGVNIQNIRNICGNFLVHDSKSYTNLNIFWD